MSDEQKRYTNAELRAYPRQECPACHALVPQGFVDSGTVGPNGERWVLTNTDHPGCPARGLTVDELLGD